MLIKIILVVLGTVFATIIGLGICQFIEGIILRKQSDITKYTYFRAIISDSFAMNSRQLKVSLIYGLGFTIIIAILITSFTNHVWMGITYQIDAMFLPYFLSALVLRHSEDSKGSFNKELKGSYKWDMIISVIILSFIGLILLISGLLSELLFMVIGCTISVSVISLAIWIVLGGIGRLIKRIVKRLSKIKLPKLRFKLPKPIPQT